MTTRGDALRAHFPAELVKTAPTRGGFRATYVEDESVMDRLDEVLGLGAWQWTVEAVGPDVVRGALLVQWEAGGEWCRYQDFGYATNPQGAEPLKEASTDAFRRCGRLVGIARYIYAGEVAPAPVAKAPRPVAVPPPAAAEPDDGGPPLTWDELPVAAAAVLDAQAVWLCPVHSEPWKHFTGTAKSTGNPYDFWGCPKGRECKERPTSEWVHEQRGDA